MRIITGALAFFASSAGMIAKMSPVALLPNPPPVYSLISDDLVGIHVQPASQTGQGLHGALRPHVNEHLAVLPVGHRGARLQRLVAGVRRDEGFVEDQGGLLESRVHVAVGPLVRRLAHRQAAFLASAKSAAVHFSSPTWGGGGLGGFSPGLAGGAGGLIQTLPSVRGLGPPGRRLSSGSTTNGSCSNSMSILSIASAAVSSSTAATARIGSPWYTGSLVSAFSPRVGLDDRAQIGDAVGRRGKIIRGEDGFDAGHGQRFAHIDVLHARVRHRAEQQLAEQHALRAEVLRVLRLAGHLREQIGRRVVLADQLVCSDFC